MLSLRPTTYWRWVSLVAGPDGLTLGEERFHRAPEVMTCVTGVDEVVVQAWVQSSVRLHTTNQFLCSSDSERGVGRDCPGRVGYYLIENLSIDDLGCQASGEGFGCLDQASGKKDFFQPSRSDQVQEPGAVGGRQTIAQCACYWYAETGSRTTDPQVTCYRYHAATANGGTLNPGDGRFGHPFQPIDHPLEPGLVCESILGGSQFPKLTDVGTSHECLVVGAAQHEDANIRVRIDCFAGVYESVVHGPRHSVSSVLAIEGKCSDWAIGGVEGIGCGHVVALLDK